jgi:tetratricopeptide (TPR) repeat protein
MTIHKILSIAPPMLSSPIQKLMAILGPSEKPIFACEPEGIEATAEAPPDSELYSSTKDAVFSVTFSSLLALPFSSTGLEVTTRIWVGLRMLQILPIPESELSTELNALQAISVKFTHHFLRQDLPPERYDPETINALTFTSKILAANHRNLAIRAFTKLQEIQPENPTFQEQILEIHYVWFNSSSAEDLARTPHRTIVAISFFSHSFAHLERKEKLETLETICKLLAILSTNLELLEAIQTPLQRILMQCNKPRTLKAAKRQTSHTLAKARSHAYLANGAPDTCISVVIAHLQTYQEELCPEMSSHLLQACLVRDIFPPRQRQLARVLSTKNPILLSRIYGELALITRGDSKALYLDKAKEFNPENGSRFKARQAYKSRDFASACEHLKACVALETCDQEIYFSALTKAIETSSRTPQLQISYFSSLCTLLQQLTPDFIACNSSPLLRATSSLVHNLFNQRSKCPCEPLSQFLDNFQELVRNPTLRTIFQEPQIYNRLLEYAQIIFMAGYSAATTETGSPTEPLQFSFKLFSIAKVLLPKHSHFTWKQYVTFAHSSACCEEKDMCLELAREAATFRFPPEFTEQISSVLATLGMHLIRNRKIAEGQDVFELTSQFATRKYCAYNITLGFLLDNNFSGAEKYFRRACFELALNPTPECEDKFDDCRIPESQIQRELMQASSLITRSDKDKSSDSFLKIKILQILLFLMKDLSNKLEIASQVIQAEINSFCFSQALVFFNQITPILPPIAECSTRVCNTIGSLHAWHGEWEQAKPWLEQAVISPESKAFSLINMGLGLFLTGQFAEAHVWFSRALEPIEAESFTPSFIYYSCFSIASLMIRKQDQAIKYYQTAFPDKSAQTTATIHFLETYHATSDPITEIENLERTQEDSSNNEKLYLQFLCYCHIPAPKPPITEMF